MTAAEPTPQEQALATYGVADMAAFVQAAEDSDAFKACGPFFPFLTVLTDAQEAVGAGNAVAAVQAINRAKYLAGHFFRSPQPAAVVAASDAAAAAGASAPGDCVAAAVNTAWMARYGGQPVEASGALAIRVCTIAADRDAWLSNSRSNQRYYLTLDAQVRRLEAELNAALLACRQPTPAAVFARLDAMDQVQASAILDSVLGIFDVEADDFRARLRAEYIAGNILGSTILLEV